MNFSGLLVGKVIRSAFIGVPIFALFLAASPSATAQLSNLFSSSQGTQANGPRGQTTPALPVCPPAVADQPESTAADGTPWVPGLNCTLESEAGRVPSQGNATGAPLNTVDPTLVSEPAPGDAGPVASQPAAGQPVSNPTYDTSVSDWRTGPADRVGTSLEAAQGRIGLSYVYWPDYLGADTGDYRAALMVDMTFGAGGFLNNDDGLGWRLVTLNGLEAKVSLNWHEAQVFTGRTQGIHDIGNRTHFEADVTFTDLGMTYELEYSKPLSGFDGWTLTAAISLEVPMQTGTLTTRFGLTHGSRDWMRSYYGIDAQESAASGLAEYTPGAGLRDVFFEATVDIPVAAQYGFEVSGGVRRMLGPASNAPQVRDVGSPTDYTLGATFYYRF